MHEVIEAAVFVTWFFGVIVLFVARRLPLRLVSFVVLVLCLVYYLFQLKVL